jgi:hypothetical protein
MAIGKWRSAIGDQRLVDLAKRRFGETVRELDSASEPVL